MSEIDDFVTTPTVEAFDAFSKDQLVLLAELYEVLLSSSDKGNKGGMKTLIRDVLVKKEVLPAAPEPPLNETPPSGLLFEQQEEFLLLQLDKSRTLIEKCRLERDVKLAKQELERERLALERKRLILIEEGKLGPTSPVNPDNVDVTKNIRLLPKFVESNVDTFFNLFEHVADLYNWPDVTRCLMLQCTLSGQAAQAYSALGVPESHTYSCVKKAVLKAYELVPEAYHQKFCGMRKHSGQSYVEFADELSVQ